MLTGYLRAARLTSDRNYSMIMKGRVTASLDLLLIITTFSTTLSQDTCGSIGNSNENALNAERGRMFYLNIANPAPCTGNVISWRVCYYGPNQDPDDEDFFSYWATYAVYRKMGSGADEHYEQVSQLFSAVTTTNNLARIDSTGATVDAVIRQQGFTCYDDSITAPLTVQAGDIVGACVFNPTDGSFFTRRQLDVVGRVNGESLLRMGSGGCSITALPTEIRASQLSTVNSRRLHIYANIEPTVVTTLTQTEISTAPSTATPTTNNPPSVTIQPQTDPPQTQDQPEGTEMDENHMTTEASLSSQQTGRSGGLAPAAIVGVVIGLLIVLVLGVAIVVVVLYLARRRQEEEKNSAGRMGYGKVSALDNLTYGSSSGDATVSITVSMKEDPSLLEASMYEVPFSAAQSINGSTGRDHEYELTGSFYAVPNMYEYATLGPNGAVEVSSEYHYSPLDEATISYTKLLEKNKQEDIYGNVEEYLQPASGENELYAQIKAHGIKNIPSNLIQVQGHLGSGQFGSVKQGSWKNGTRSIPVALKLLKEEASEMDKVKFLQEAAIMAQFTHPNVVSLYGVVSKTEPLMLVVELIHRGDLRNHLHTLRPDPGELPVASMPKLLLSFCQQVALGMHYLSAKGFVHRDLAARNILVSKDNICKVADFGMSRDLADENYYVSQGGKVPVKWTAPEAIHYKKYSTASDVWSYGCLLYEIWSLGYKPFEGVGNAKVIELVDSGKRLPPPPGCSRVSYELMIQCWNPVTSQRPSFRELLLTLLNNPEEVLSIPPGTLGTHHLAGVLGSPLEAGEGLYRDLRDRYLQTDDDYQELD